MTDKASQYSFLSRQWPELFQEALRVEEFALSDARTACFYARRTMELLVEWVYDNDSQLQRPLGYGTLADLIFAADFRQLASEQMPRFRLLKQLGNKAVHHADPIRPGEAVLAAGELFQVLRWFALTYGQDPSSLRGCRFDRNLLPSTNAQLEQQAQSQAQLEALAEQLAERDQQLRDQRLASLASTEELDRLRKEITALRKANQAAAQPEPDLSEFETRQDHINLYLEEAGWVHGQSCTHEHKVDGMPNATGQGFVDYVLWGDDGKALALVEAKTTSRDPMEGQRQAELYANALERRYGQRPLIFLSNGYRHRIWDDLRYPPRDVQGFYKKAELETLIRRRDTLLPLAPATISTGIADRHYQGHAIRAIADSLEKGLRKVLLVQATGTGKTRTAIALTDLLIRCNWIKRILFLADRTALVIQAERAFRRFLPDASPVNLVTNRGGEGRVFLSTYPTMMNLIDTENSDSTRRFGVGHFDLVIIDEAHRSVYQKYGAIFGYFDSLLTGLTATPRDEIDRNTYELFELDVGMPTDEYGLDQAIADGYLVPFKAIPVPLKFPREGIHYADLSDEEKAQWDLNDWEENELGDRVESGAINSWLFNADTVDKALQVLMTQGCRDSNGDGIGKSIIFARNHRHALFIQERFDHHFPHLAGKTARVIHNKIAYAQSLIEEFSNPASGLQIAISVDMLDTGIDIPEIVNLMIFKPVRSRTKFWQMVGRGTRLCPDLFGPGRDKECFWIFDCCQNLEFFIDGGGNTVPSMPETLTAKLFKTRLALIDTLDHTSTLAPNRSSPDLASHRQTLAEILRGHVAACPADNFQVRPHLELVERFRRPESWQTLSPEDHVVLATTLAPLPSGQATQEGENDATARRFDLLLYQMQLAWLKGDARFARLQEGLNNLASQLEQQHNNPIVAREMDLIQSLLQEEWWQDLTLSMLEDARLRLRGLICMIETQGQSPIYTNFTDELGELKEIDTSALITRDTFRQFRMRARAFLLEHDSHLTMQRLRRNQPLTPSDLRELERFLISHGIGDQELINRAAEEANGFGLFIRSLVGLDRSAAKALFAEFLAEGTHTATQIRFINDIIDELTNRGVMDPARLYDPPFSDLAPSGPEDLFSEDEIENICSVLKTISRRAMPQVA